MKIKKLDIVGFKSFLDKASIAFPAGICAIVGPNGCGKSNVIDALRWVMGEQSVKQLRGKAMEDVIFAGATNKPPMNMAEVTLTMVNDNGHAPEEFKDFSEISVTRRLYRSGESAYLINRQPCRLKDIYNLFMGSGVGSRTFAIIQQGNIGAIIDAGPDERRLFIEEAAGVTRYKFRKNEALRKVKATEQNLLRINDIIAEVNRQMAGLRRQAKKAERYKSFKQRIRRLDTHLLLNYYDQYSVQINDTEKLLKELRDTDISHVTQLKKIDAAVEEIKLKRWQKNQEISKQKSEKFESQRKIDRTEAERAHLKEEIQRLDREASELQQAKTTLKEKTAGLATEVAQTQAQNEQVQTQIDQLRRQIDAQRSESSELNDTLGRLNERLEASKSNLMTLVAEEARYKNIYQNASNNKENVQRRLKRIDEEVALAAQKVAAATKEKDQAQGELDQVRQAVATYEKQIAEVRALLGQKANDLGQQVKQTQTLDVERNKARSQLGALKKMAANYEWYRDGVKAVMQARRTPNAEKAGQAAQLGGIIGLMAEVIEPAPGYETAVEAVLGEALQYVLVENQQAGVEAIAYLRDQSAGRGGFIPIDQAKPLCGAETDAAESANRLLNHVVCEEKFQPVAEALLGHVAVTDSIDQALTLYNRNGRVQTIVTRQGDVVAHQGLLVGGSEDQLSGILAKKQELKSLARTCAELDQALEEAQQRQQTLEEAVRKLEIELQQKTSARHQAVDEANEIEKLLYRLGEDLKNARRHQEIVELEQEQLLGEESDLDEELAGYNQALAKITDQVQQCQADTAGISQQITQVASRLEGHNQKIVDLKLQLTAQQTKLENGMQTLNRLRDFERDSQQRLQQLDQDLLLKTGKRETAGSNLAQAEEGLQRMYDVLKRLESQLDADESEYSTIDAFLQENDQQVAAIQTEREKTLEKMRLVELDLSEKRMLRENINGKAQERYHTTVQELRAKPVEQEQTPGMSIAEMEKELARFRAKIDSIGDVHLGAIEEYEELKKRFDFLSEQRDDLVKAIDDLHKVIRKINRITQERFIETYEQVNLKLKEVFPRLFEGGTARLELSEPGKPLETGVEYLVHPPGKKLTRMSLLSGGEKALSAIAFIFAIFLIRPASFCLLDEIDAPLDEANVVRFNNLMQVIGEKSQIIMITHNKKTMEFADTLFGVTMEQKGISKVVSVNLQGREA